MPSRDEAAKVDVAALGAAVRARLEERLRRAFRGCSSAGRSRHASPPPPAARGQGYDAGAELRRRCAEIVRVHGRRPMASWLRLLLCVSIGHAEPQLPALRLTHDIQRLYRREWCRILDSVESLPDAFFDPAEDKFQKDLALVRLRLIPAGAGLVDPTYRVACRFLLARGPWQAGRGAWFLLVRAGGLWPYYRFHLDSRFLQRRLDERQVDVSWPDLMRDLTEVRAVDLTLDGQRYRLRTDLCGSAYHAFAAASVRPPAIVTSLGPAPTASPPSSAEPEVEVPA